MNATTKLLTLTSSRQALRAASTAAASKTEEKGAWGLRSEKKKTFAIYRWDPEQPGAKPKMENYVAKCEAMCQKFSKKLQPNGFQECAKKTLSF